MKYIMLFVFGMLFTLLAIGQYPKGLPSPYSNGFAQIGYSKVDSGSILTSRDTGWIPRFPNTVVLWRHIGVDTCLWIWNTHWSKLTVPLSDINSIVSASALTFSNGLTKNGSQVTLGGELTDTATITTVNPILFKNPYNGHYLLLSDQTVDVSASANFFLVSLNQSGQYQTYSILKTENAKDSGFFNSVIRVQDSSKVTIGSFIPFAADNTHLLPSRDTAKTAIIETDTARVHVYAKDVEFSVGSRVVVMPKYANSRDTLATLWNIRNYQNTSTPTISVGDNAGTGATATLVSGSNSTRGSVIIHTGTSPVSGAIALCSITFGTAYANTPFVAAYATDNPTLSISAFAPQSAASTTGFQINCNSSVSSSTYYQVNYIVSQ